jgi:hypothetical protein
MFRVKLAILSVATVLAVTGCAKSGDDVSDEGIGEVAGLLQADWEVEQTGVSDAVIDPLAAKGSTDDPGGATIDVLITVNTVKNGNGVLVRRNTSGKGTKCFRYTIVNDGSTVKVKYAQRACPKT